MANLSYYNNLLSATEAARYLKVSYQTILKYVKKGYISTTDLSLGSERPVYGFREIDLINFESRKKKIYKKRGRKPGTKVEVNRDQEIDMLKSKIRILSEELLELSIKLDELSK